MQGTTLRDARHKVSLPLSSDGSLVTSSAIDLEHNASGQSLNPVEFRLSAPALTGAQIDDNVAWRYRVWHSSNANLSSPVLLFDNAIVQTGNSGAAAATFKFKPPIGCKRYVYFDISCEEADDAHTATAILELLF